MVGQAKHGAEEMIRDHFGTDERGEVLQKLSQ